MKILTTYGIFQKKEICENIQWYADEEALWYQYRFNNFEIWSDDRMIIRVPNTKHLLINKNQ